MSASRAEALRPALAAVLALALAGVAWSHQPEAQQPAPIVTQPLAPSIEDPVAPEVIDGPQSLLVQPFAALPQQSVAGTQEGLGLLTESDGGFGPDLWAGTDRRVIEELLPKIPAATASPTLFDLARRLLLSDALLPPPAAVAEADMGEGGVAADAEANATVDLLDLRLERLSALGVMGELERLLALLPPERSPDVRKRLTVELLLTEGDETAACEHVRQGDPSGGQDGFWLKALTFCQYRQGEIAAAELGLALLRDAGREQDQLFIRLMDAALGLQPLPEGEIHDLPTGQVRGLELALLSALGHPLPTGLIDTTGPRARMQMALNDSVPLPQRAVAAEWAVSSRRLEADRLARLYESFQFQPTTIDDALNAGYRMPGVEARALYFQVLRKPGGPQQELLTAELALDSAEADGVYVGMAELVLPELVADPEDPGLAWLAAMLGRANYVLGNYEAATAWLLLALREAPVSAQAAAASLRLWPYARLAGTTMFTNEAGVDGWRYAQSDPGSAEVAEQAGFLHVLFQALGEADALVWAEPAEDEAKAAGEMPDATVLFALEEASRAGRLGETVLRVLVLLGEGNPAEADPQALGAALGALMQVGLPLEARALAIEAALGKGI
ncbi:MAG TPA: hypothetical protein VJL84_06080 [Kiloniellales bacterium]|nr:hypothetical protein [Kiloniellales bacterium]